MALSIPEIAREEAEARGGVRVSAIHLRLGAMSGIVPAAPESACQLAQEQAEFRSCSLLIEEAPVIIDCAEWRRGSCAHCNGFARRIRPAAPEVLQGREPQIAGLEPAS